MEVPPFSAGHSEMPAGDRVKTHTLASPTDGPGFHTMEGNVLLNDALDTFYLWLYGVGNMVKDHRERIVHTTNFLAPVVKHWLDREIAQLVQRSMRRLIALNKRSTTKRLDRLERHARCLARTN